MQELLEGDGSVILMVTGGRNFGDRAMIRRNLMPFELGDILILGGATGLDEIARQIWHTEKELPYVVMPAPWKRTGKPAGIMRNMAMIKGLALAPYAILIPELIIAFPGGTGTNHAKEFGESYGTVVVDAQ